MFNFKKIKEDFPKKLNLTSVLKTLPPVTITWRRQGGPKG